MVGAPIMVTSKLRMSGRISLSAYSMTSCVVVKAVRCKYSSGMPGFAPSILESNKLHSCVEIFSLPVAKTTPYFDFEKSTITMNKSYQRINREDVITTPKTPKSNRVVTMPNVLAECLKAYISQCYDLDEENRIFPYTKYFLTHEMQRGCKKSGVKKIRIHDIRHSHASLLVEMGFSPLLIAERLGHERVQTTMETYSHLYPNKQVEVANRLDSL